MNYTVTGSADQVLNDKIHVVISVEIDGQPSPVTYDRWVPLADWQEDRNMVISQMAEYKVAQIATAAASVPQPASDIDSTPVILTSADVAAKMDTASPSADNQAESER